MTLVTKIFESVGANVSVNCADSCEEYGIVFAAGRTVARHKDGQLHRLKGHKSTVTSLICCTLARAIISGSEDGEIRVWTENDAHCYQAHEKSVTSLNVNDEGNLLVSSSADGSVKLWRLSSDSDSKITLSLITTRRFGARFYPLIAQIGKCKDAVLVAVGGTQNVVHLFSVDLNGASSLESPSIALEGHENWVRGLAFKQHNGNLYLASAAQDHYIRLWRIVTVLPETNLLSNKIYPLDTVAGFPLYVSFDALLMGHDDWVFSLRWHPTEFKLLSCSADSCSMIWQPDETSSVWLCSARFGEMSIKGSSTATGSSGGFMCALWLDSITVASTGKTGSWRIWKQQSADSWAPQTAITGHTKSVTDVCFYNDSYLLTTSLDQTTRLFAVSKTDRLFHEFGRPQIHGYDMELVRPINATRFISAGAEKVMRVFDMPESVAKLLENMCGLTNVRSDLPSIASVPALGLSNKSAGEEESNEDHASFLPLDSIPLEEQLERHTLWPEIDKIYGHGYEISSIDVSHTSSFIASTCRSNTEDNAGIRINQIKGSIFPPVCDSDGKHLILKFHSLSVTRTRFSPDDQMLLAVSRDRSFSLWKTDGWKMMQGEKGHTRIIWDCAWLANDAFVTVGRDKVVKKWGLKDGKFAEILQEKFDESVTAVDVSRATKRVALGFDSGKVIIVDFDLKVLSEVATFPDARINRLSFNDKGDRLACASEDASLTVYSL